MSTPRVCIECGAVQTVHGTRTAYTHHGCRCADCRAVHAREGKANRARRNARMTADPTIVAHGKTSTYINWGCRCADCRAALSAYRKAKKS